MTTGNNSQVFPSMGQVPGQRMPEHALVIDQGKFDRSDRVMLVRSRRDMVMDTQAWSTSPSIPRTARSCQPWSLTRARSSCHTWYGPFRIFANAGFAVLGELTTLLGVRRGQQETLVTQQPRHSRL